MNFNPTLWSRRIEAVPARHFVIGAVAMIAAVGIVDHFTGPMTMLTIFYLVPVAATAWVVGPRAGGSLALLAALTWAFADSIGPFGKPKAALGYVNDLSMLVIFLFSNMVIGLLRDQVQKQRDLIQDVQRHLLPAIPSVANVELAARWIPAWTVGGDYYDVIDAGPHRVAICLADVSGKGMAAALIMSNVQATVRALNAGALTPDRLIATLNRLLYRRLRRESFVTIFFGILDPVSGELTFCNSGHTPPLVSRKDGTLARLDSTGPVAGIFAEAAYRSVTIRLAAGDRLVIFSDGVTESENVADEEFGEQRLRKVLLRGNTLTAEETCDAIVETLTAFRGSRPYNDDVTMLVVARTAAAEQSEVEDELITCAAL
jgi:sigma-B regulation protein RsbU (phosphoserine phosphatase)